MKRQARGIITTLKEQSDLDNKWNILMSPYKVAN